MIVPIALGLGSLATLFLTKKSQIAFSASRIVHPSHGGFVVICDRVLRRDVPEGPIPQGTRVGLAVAGPDGTIFRGEGVITSGLEASYFAIAWIREIERVTGKGPPPAPGETMIAASDGIARILLPTQAEERAAAEARMSAARAAAQATQSSSGHVTTKVHLPKTLDVSKIPMPPRESEKLEFTLSPILRNPKYETDKTKIFTDGDDAEKIVIFRTFDSLGDKAPQGMDAILFFDILSHRAKLAIQRTGESIFELFDMDDVHASMSGISAPKKVNEIKIEGPITEKGVVIAGAIEDCGNGDIRAFGFTFDGKNASVFADTAIAEGPRLSISAFANWLLPAVPKTEETASTANVIDVKIEETKESKSKAKASGKKANGDAAHASVPAEIERDSESRISLS